MPISSVRRVSGYIPEHNQYEKKMSQFRVDIIFLASIFASWSRNGGRITTFHRLMMIQDVLYTLETNYRHLSGAQTVE